MAEAFDTCELVEALQPERDPDFFPLNDLPNDVLVSVFAVAAAEDPTWVRHTFPCVCKAWNDLYLSQNASPLHETLEVDFSKEVDRADAAAAAAAAAAREGEGRHRVPAAGARRTPVVHASRVLAWAEGRSGSVRKLLLSAGWLGEEMESDRFLKDFSAEDMGKLVAVLGSSLTDISIGRDIRELLERPFWESLRTTVVPARRLRSLEIRDADFVTFGSYLEDLGEVAGSLEELELHTRYSAEFREFPDLEEGLWLFPEPFFALKKLRRLVLVGHPQMTVLPAAGIPSLKKLEALQLVSCGLQSLPKELGEFSGLTKLDLSWNEGLGTTLPSAEAFPAELGNMKSLRKLYLPSCGLRTVPAFVRKLKSLESLDLRSNHLSSLPKELGELSRLTKLDVGGNKNLGTTAAAFPAELGKMKSLRELDLTGCRLRAVPAFVGELESLEGLTLHNCGLSSLPKELGELSRLTMLNISNNMRLGTTLPAELGKLKSLRELYLSWCGLRTFPAFVGELGSLEVLDLRFNNDLQIDAPLDFLLEGCPRLRQVIIFTVNMTPESRAQLEAFKAKLRAKNPDAEVFTSLIF